MLIWCIALLRIAVRIALCFLIADLIVGLVHWAEDSYGAPDWPIIGQSVIAPNLLHHADPRAFLAHGWWAGADYQAIAGAAVLGLALALGWFSADLLLVVVLAVNANEFHKWSHRSRTENGRLINLLHDLHLLQGRRHHNLHHGGERNTHYCTITCWVNPLLERLRLWRGLEAAIRGITGATPRIDPVVLARRRR